MGEPQPEQSGARTPEGVKYRTGSRTRSAAEGEHRTGEDRYLTPVGVQYAPGSAGQGVGPQGRKTCPACLAASGGFGAQPHGFQLVQPSRWAAQRSNKAGGEAGVGAKRFPPSTGPQ